VTGVRPNGSRTRPIPSTGADLGCRSRTRAASDHRPAAARRWPDSRARRAPRPGRAVCRGASLLAAVLPRLSGQHRPGLARMAGPRPACGRRIHHPVGLLAGHLAGPQRMAARRHAALRPAPRPADPAGLLGGPGRQRPDCDHRAVPAAQRTADSAVNGRLRSAAARRRRCARSQRRILVDRGGSRPVRGVPTRVADPPTVRRDGNTRRRHGAGRDRGPALPRSVHRIESDRIHAGAGTPVHPGCAGRRHRLRQ